MNNAFDSLPWLLASISALLVGVASMVSGAIVWEALARAGLAFVVFGLIGAVVRRILAAQPKDTTDRSQQGEAGERNKADKADNLPGDERRSS